MFSPWREATAPPTSISTSTSPAPVRTSITRRRTEPSARYRIEFVSTASGEARPGDAHVVGVSGELLTAAGEGQPFAGRQLDDVFGQRPDPQLRSG